MKNMSTAAAGQTRRISVIKWNGRENPSKETMNEELLSKESLPNMKGKSFAGFALPSCPVGSERKNENKYSCSFCKKSFKWRSHWKSHERIHTGERPFQCEICGKTFTRSDGLQCHKALHTSTLDSCSLYESEPNMRRFHEVQSSLPVCRLCSKRCYSFAGLMKHMQKHKGATNYKCEVCKKMFTKRSALGIHSRVHTGIKPYRCNICTKTFSIHGNLKRHLLIHSGERPYVCLKCSKCFNNSSHLTRHIKAKHPAEEKSTSSKSS